MEVDLSGFSRIFRTALPAALLAAAAGGPLPGAASPPEAHFVGSAKCRTCHFAEHRSWVATRMAKAFDVLKPGAVAEAKKKAGLDPGKDYTSGPACLGCHATGYGKPGGFVSLARTPELAGVQCEACHGAAGEYLKQGKMTLANREYKRADLVAAGLVLQSAATCATLCHNEKSPTHKPLDYGLAKAQEVHAIVPLKFKHD